ncbi:hypothetical protein LTR36_005539 [Oleoguttula mirabilis]|uniref:FAD-binding domain-containing protein n=1 Tax=Oleoguttula mirabilis TaxID=1507867 RepID=A0AAV9JF39_9PEZI|nr:hypothetical protein LTR36_005539 [Oleoguttula mirabilis]
MGSTGTGTTSLALDIKIIGAGIGGLACGLALARKGHHITIFEASKELSEFGAGIQLTPNATRLIISQWGLRDEFLKYVNVPGVMTVRRYSDDSIIGEIAHNPMTEWEYGYPHWQIYRPDFQALLADGAHKAGVSIRFDHTVTAVDPDKGELTLKDGTKQTADLIIGADGIKSRSRSCLSDAEARAFKEYCFRAVVPRAKMEQDPETAMLMAGHLSMTWVGPGVAVLGYTIAAGQMYNFLVAVPRPSDAPVGKWNEPGDPNEMASMLQDFCPVVKKVCSYVDDCAKWTLGDLPPIESYVSSSGRFVLVGDAAHAIVPHLGSGAAMALEDAAALAEFVSAIKDHDELAALMHAYHDFRQPRIESIRKMAYGNQVFLTMEDGPGQEERDKLWAAMTSKWKTELKDLGEEGLKTRPKPTPDPSAQSLRTPEGREFLYGYDVVAEARKTLRMGSL